MLRWGGLSLLLYCISLQPQVLQYSPFLRNHNINTSLPEKKPMIGFFILIQQYFKMSTHQFWSICCNIVKCFDILPKKLSKLIPFWSNSALSFCCFGSHSPLLAFTLSGSKTGNILVVLLSQGAALGVRPWPLYILWAWSGRTCGETREDTHTQCTVRAGLQPRGQPRGQPE